ncbi:hypothetical protein N7G274_008743 [Stereocaulon virgatum]|uniref:Uncharacterized protein n=1 Tax=Stereocaulon virgatum TaxID=373712 RepID=A0ABR4A0U6_9LECA
MTCIGEPRTGPTRSTVCVHKAKMSLKCIIAGLSHLRPDNQRTIYYSYSLSGSSLVIMKISRALLFLPLAVAMPGLRLLGDIEITLALDGKRVSVTDDDDYYSCLVKTYPPDYTDCPAGYDAVPIIEGKKTACCTKNKPDADILPLPHEKVSSLLHDTVVSKNCH